jgi:hypothetical protein
MTDDELLAQLRSRDPAASLPPAAPAQVARLLEDAMTNDLETDPQTNPRRRTPLTWLVAAAAILVIAGVGAFALFGGADQPGTTTIAKDTEPTVMELSARPATNGKCAAVTAEFLAGMETAFDGTVTSIDDRLVTLEVGHWYRGGDTDLVTVQAPPEVMQDLLIAASFQTGQRYLVSANGGYVTVCGFTAAYSEELAALYAEAFGA